MTAYAPVLIPMQESAPRRPPAATILDAAVRIIEDVSWIEPTGLYPSFGYTTFPAITPGSCPAVTLVVTDLAAAVQSGGTLALGAYFYVITVTTPYGESVISNEVTGTAASTNRQIHLTWSIPDFVGTTPQYKIYRTAVGGASGSETFLAAVLSGNTYTDDGSVTLGTATPPTDSSAFDYPVKNFYGEPTPVDGARFGLYQGMECGEFASTDGMAELAASLFTEEEFYGVEQGVMQQLLGGGSLAFDITPAGGAVDITDAIALLEGCAATNYRGLGTMHLSRSTTAKLWQANYLTQVGTEYFTKQGSKVISGSYSELNSKSPAGAAPADGIVWCYVSGDVTIRRSAMISNFQLDRSNNKRYALAERLYVVDVDVFAAGIKVKVPGS